jgi:hypothetical protein
LDKPSLAALRRRLAYNALKKSVIVAWYKGLAEPPEGFDPFEMHRDDWLFTTAFSGYLDGGKDTKPVLGKDGGFSVELALGAIADAARGSEMPCALGTGAQDLSAQGSGSVIEVLAEYFNRLDGQGGYA